MKTPPTFSTDFGIYGLTQIYATSMKIEWDVEDTESFIKRQYLSIKSHLGGEFMLSSQKVGFFYIYHLLRERDRWCNVERSRLDGGVMLSVIASTVV